jgi:methyl-accepting chemotaxis protein
MMLKDILANCRIGYQVAMLGVIGLLGVVLVAATSWHDIDAINKIGADVAAVRDAKDLETALQISLLQARRYEKDFLLRRNDASTALHAAAMQEAIATLAALQEKYGQAPEINRRLRETGAGIARYRDGFLKLVADAKLVGMNENQGFLGELRASVHAVEETLNSVDAPAAQIAMLMMRRHEKDFIARLDPKYGTALQAERAKFAAAIDASALPPASKAATASRMADYQDTFVRFMTGTLDEKAQTKLLSSLYAGIEPLLAALDKIFADQAKAAQRDGAAAAAASAIFLIEAIAAIVAAVAAFSWFVGVGISRPIILVTRTMAALGKGQLDVAIPSDGRRDEIGTMISTVRSFRDSLVEAQQLRKDKVLELEAGAEKRAALVRMAERIESDASGVVAKISGQTTSMVTTVEEMQALADRTGASAQAAAGSAAAALGNAQSVASATEELSASIREISAQVSLSTKVVGKAVTAGLKARSSIEALNERVSRIGAVADMIGSIAARTNLLSLNATIEAARAGDAGKGFAVVASEVKQLANQTARSTKEIVDHITAVRNATAEAVAAVAQIGATINEVNEIAGSIAAAVEQQGAATAEIARNVTETASAVDEVTSRNTEVSNEAERAKLYAAEMLASTTKLNNAVAELRTAIIRTVRTSAPEVQRRQSERYVIDLECHVAVAGKAAERVRVVELSEGGGRVIGAADLTIGARGTLSLPGLNAPVLFEVRDNDLNMARLAFLLDDATRNAMSVLIKGLSAPRAA